MARSKRENLLILGVAAAVGVFALDRYVLTPFATAREAIDADRAVAADQLADNSRLFQRERKLRKDWADMQAAGVNEQPSEAERRMLYAVRQWAQDAGVRNLSLRPERTNKEFGFVKVTVHATGSAQTAAVAKMLWSVESAAMPVRVDNVQMTPTRGEGVDDVQVTMTISTLCAGGELERRNENPRQAVASVRPPSPQSAGGRP
jgi:hypothetical protein